MQRAVHMAVLVGEETIIGKTEQQDKNQQQEEMIARLTRGILDGKSRDEAGEKQTGIGRGERERERDSQRDTNPKRGQSVARALSTSTKYDNNR